MKTPNQEKNMRSTLNTFRKNIKLNTKNDDQGDVSVTTEKRKSLFLDDKITHIILETAESNLDP